MGDGESQTGTDSPGHGQIKGHGTKFDRKTEEAIMALLTHPTVEAADRAALKTAFFRNVELRHGIGNGDG